MGDVATRKAFGDALVRIGADERVVVLTGDLKNSTHVEDFAAKYPDRFFDVGIAESNMIGVAAGLALSGKIPFACSFSAFITGRQETVRLSVGYNRANVRLVGTHVGVGIGDDGASQMALEDIAAMRAFGDMAIIQPCDEIETHRAVDYLLDHPGPAFLRLMRQGTKAIHTDDYRFEFGKVEILRDGGDIALVATGGLVQESLIAADELAREGISARVLNVHTIAPLDDDTVARAARECGRVITAEDHNVNGGLGSAVAEAIAESGSAATLKRVGLHTFGESGSQQELYDKFGLSGARIADSARAFLKS
ncbi:MAG: transketolase family protein [Actinomycetota bacterium]